VSFFRGETVNGQRFCSCGCGKEAKRHVTNGRFKGWRAYATGHSPHERTDIRIPDDPTVLAYAAGIVDGEGCVYARAWLRPDGLFHTTVQLQVTMCSASVIKYLYDAFGGRVYTDVPRSGHAQYKRRFIWSINNRKVRVILAALLPYLIEKRQRAEIAIQLANMMGERGKGRKFAVPQTERDERIRLAAQIKAFNRNTAGEDELGASIH
jgi:hypothetical protein